MSEHIHTFLSQWTTAERAGDADVADPDAETGHIARPAASADAEADEAVEGDSDE